MSALLCADDVARRLNVGKARIYLLTRNNMIPFVRVGRSVRYDPDAIETWIKSGGQSLPEAPPEEPTQKKRRRRSR
jgi:excisionase family DNA binding protein